MNSKVCLLPALLWPVVVPSQFAYTTNNGTLTLISYSGPGGSVTIPGKTNGLPITSIGRAAFYDLPTVTEIIIPDNVTNIEADAFGYCYKMTNALIGKGVARIGNGAFCDCWSLTNVYFHGDAPSLGPSVFFDDSATVYYLSGTKGWASTLGGRPTLLWKPQDHSTNSSPVAKQHAAGVGASLDRIGPLGFDQRMKDAGDWELKNASYSQATQPTNSLSSR